jgi:hypothetical protein
MSQHDLVFLFHQQGLPVDKIYERLIEIFGLLALAH